MYLIADPFITASKNYVTIHYMFIEKCEELLLKIKQNNLTLFKQGKSLLPGIYPIERRIFTIHDI